jgi:hypothetical protein
MVVTEAAETVHIVLPQNPVTCLNVYALPSPDEPKKSKIIYGQDGSHRIRSRDLQMLVKFISTQQGIYIYIFLLTIWWSKAWGKGV